jgi:hypothetical protein
MELWAKRCKDPFVVSSIPVESTQTSNVILWGLWPRRLLTNWDTILDYRMTKMSASVLLLEIDALWLPLPG